jgi:hypothetical protein
MVRSATDIEACTVGELDGAIGKINDCVFDEVLALRFSYDFNR